MKTPVTRPKYGFRFSVLDAVVLILTMAASIWLRKLNIELWWVLPVVIVHFFLFCNVFMVWRKYELIWAVIFVMNVMLHVLILDNPGWWPACIYQVPVTLIIIGIQMRSPWYHGIAARFINPHLADYLDGGLKRQPKNLHQNKFHQ